MKVTNTSPESVWLFDLDGDIHGDLDGQGTCDITPGEEPSREIAAGGNYTCTFTATFNGNAGDSETDTVSCWGEGGCNAR